MGSRGAKGPQHLAPCFHGVTKVTKGFVEADPVISGRRVRHARELTVVMGNLPDSTMTPPIDVP